MKILKLVVIFLVCCFSSNILAGEKKIDQYTQWAITIANSEMKHNPELWQADFVKQPKWDYTQGLVAKSMMVLYDNTKDTAYYNYTKRFADYFVNDKGEILTYKKEDYSLDKLNGGKFLFDMYQSTKDAKYLKAIKMLRTQFDTHPRVSQGVYWHKKIYPNQVWLDGLYMGAPFYAQCAKEFKEPVASFNDAAKQLVIGDSVTLDVKTGLNYHAWDESRDQKWADPKTGHSPNFWGRSMGWYMMAMVDILDYLPQNHPQRKTIIANLTRLTDALIKYQDSKTGMWYQITDQPARDSNYVESSCTAMFTYAIAKAVNNKYLSKEYASFAYKSFWGMVKFATKKNDDGTTSITKACSVAGLGGNPYRDGSFQYYIGEPIRSDDPKVIGPFIMAALEMSKMCK